MKMLEKISEFVGNTFAIWVLLFTLLAYFYPDAFTWIAPYIVPLLGIIMFGMGLTLSSDDFEAVFRRPRDVAIGVGAQYIIMPLLALGLASIFPLSNEVAAGVILVGSCPGGTASNVMTYLSKGDTALSVTITSVSTLLAPVVTPGLVLLFASKWIPISALALFWSIIKIVILPLILGFGVKMVFGDKVKAGIKALPLVSVIVIVAIVAAVIGLSRDKLTSSGFIIFSVVMLHNLLGLLIGYGIAKVLNMDEGKRRALSIEVGMQNSGLAATLATIHFSPLAAVPSAIFSVWHNISGPAVANYFRRKSKKQIADEALEEVIS